MNTDVYVKKCLDMKFLKNVKICEGLTYLKIVL